MNLINYNENINYKEIFLTLTLLPYFNLYLSNYLLKTRIIALYIFINGILCHMSCAFNLKYQIYFKYNDIISNFLFIVYVNYFTGYQPNSIIITLLGMQAWILNTKCSKTWDSTLKHWIFIQLPGFYVLLNYN